jgi:aminopeptidase N
VKWSAGALGVSLVLVVVVAVHARGQAAKPAPSHPFSVTHYDVTLEPHLSTRSVSGIVTLTAIVHDDAADAITLNRGALDIDSVREGTADRAFAVDGSRVRITLPRAGSSRRRTIAISYHGTPRSGLVFVPEREQLYTIFSTSQWTVALDQPDARATLRLRLTIPAGWAAAASGREVSRHAISKDAQTIEWRQERAVPTYTFGFVAGRFETVTESASRVTLRFLGSGWSAGDLRRVFSETSSMIRFFEDRSGVSYPASTYTQALVAHTAGQEMAGLSVVSDEYGRSLLADPTAIGLLAHELAHQWWGNMVTCEAWTHFWLNEGFATFMAAAYREQRFGRDAYLEDIAAMRSRYEKIRDAGHDRSLVFPDWDHPTADDRALVYQKGALVLHELRELLGDAAFWSGLRHYTAGHFDRSVTTSDFRQAMEESSGRDLGPFFATWIGATHFAPDPHHR